ncbi:MAG: hypothetical protein RR996_01820 [Alistipes sp.]
MDARKIPANPPAAINAMALPHPLTLGTIALLEKVRSPFFADPEEETTAIETILSLYIVSLPACDAIRHLATLEHDAMAWADTLTVDEYRQRIGELQAAIYAFYSAFPRPTEETPQKKVSPATASS